MTIPFLMASLIDKGILGGDAGHVRRLGLLLIGIAAVSMTFGVLSGRFSAIAATGLSRNMRTDMFTRINGFAFSNIDRFTTGGLVTRLTTDVTNVQNAYMMIIRIAVRAPSMLLFALAMTFAVNTRVALIFLVIVPLLAAGLLLIMKKAHPIFRRVFRTYDRLNTTVQESVRGIRTVKAYVRADHEERRFREVSGTIARDFTTAERILAFNAPLMQFSVYASLLLIAWIGAHQIVGGTMSTGELVSVITYAMQILMSLMMLSMVFVMISISRASADRIAEVLGEDSDLTDPADPVEQVTDASIDFDDVDFSYNGGREPALSGITARFEPGQVIGIIGGTGSGKSTLVSLIPRLYDVTAGQVKIGGVDVRQYSLQALRSQAVIVLQQNVLFGGTVRENLRWGNPDATEAELDEACQVAQASDFLAELPNGYDSHVEQGGANFSGGQRQRLCIARALLARPKILVFDDSTSAVDTDTEARIRAGLAQTLPETTRIIIAQRVSSVRDADQILVMRGGGIQARGTHTELLESSDIYREIAAAQQERAVANE